MMVRIQLILAWVLETGVAAYTQFGPQPFATIAFIGTMALLAWLTFREILRVSKGQCDQESMEQLYSDTLERMLMQQRNQLLAEFKRVTGKSYTKIAKAEFYQEDVDFREIPNPLEQPRAIDDGRFIDTHCDPTGFRLLGSLRRGGALERDDPILGRAPRNVMERIPAKRLFGREQRRRLAFGDR